MRSFGVVLDPPLLNDTLRLGHGDEPVLVQTFVPELAVEALDVRILIRFARSDERQLHVRLVGPCGRPMYREPGLRTPTHDPR